MFPVPIDFKSCREEIAGALQEFCNRWCKREHVESNALNSWKLFDGRISFNCDNLNLPHNRWMAMNGFTPAPPPPPIGNFADISYLVEN